MNARAKAPDDDEKCPRLTVQETNYSSPYGSNLDVEGLEIMIRPSPVMPRSDSAILVTREELSAFLPRPFSRQEFVFSGGRSLGVTEL